MHIVDEPRVKSGTSPEIGCKPKTLFEAGILIDIHIREKGQMREKIERLERELLQGEKERELKNLREANRLLIQKIKELEAIIKIKCLAKSISAQARWDRQKAISQGA